VAIAGVLQAGPEESQMGDSALVLVGAFCLSVIPLP